METSKKINRTKWLTIRLLPAEYESVTGDFKATTFRKLSDYLRAVIMGKKVTIAYRNRSLDAFMEEMILLRRELNAIGNNLNQVTRRINGCQDDRELQRLLPVYTAVQTKTQDKINEIKTRLDELSDIWLHES